jgi:hypothetical protein
MGFDVGESLIKRGIFHIYSILTIAQHHVSLSSSLGLLPQRIIVCTDLGVGCFPVELESVGKAPSFVIFLQNYAS